MNFSEFKTLVDGCGTFSTLTLRLPFPIARKLLAVVEAVKEQGHESGCWGGADCDCPMSALAALEEE